MREVVFVNGKFPHKAHTLTASLNVDADLVFDDGEVYSAEDGLEVDDYLTVRAEYKSRVLDLLGQAFNGISDTCGEAEDERLFCTLERIARSGHWRSLDEIETWLMDRGVPFTKQKWVDIKQ